MNTLTLNELKPGQAAKVLGFVKNEALYRQKLLAMGVTPGASITIIRTAPLGDPMQINIRGFHLSLRKAEAKTIIVEVIK